MSRYLLYRPNASSIRNIILNVFKFHLTPSSGTVRRSIRPLFTIGGAISYILTPILLSARSTSRCACALGVFWEFLPVSCVRNTRSTSVGRSGNTDPYCSSISSGTGYVCPIALIIRAFVVPYFFKRFASIFLLISWASNSRLISLFRRGPL